MIRLVHPENLAQGVECTSTEVAGREIQLNSAVGSLRFSNRGFLLSSAKDSLELIVWDTVTIAPRFRFAHAHPVACFAIHPFHPYVISSDIHSLKTWNVEDGRLIHDEATWSWFYRGAMALAIAPDGGSISVANLSDLCSWGTSLGISRLSNLSDLTTRDALEMLNPLWFQPLVKSLTFSSDGCWLAAGGDWYPSAWVWDLRQTNRNPREIQIPRTERSTGDSSDDRERTIVAFHPTRPILAITNGTVVELRDPETLRICGRMIGHRSPINALAFNSSGSCLLTGSDDGTAKIWNVEACRSERTYDWDIGDIRAVAICPKSGLCAAGASSGSLVLWTDSSLTSA